MERIIRYEDKKSGKKRLMTIEENKIDYAGLQIKIRKESLLNKFLLKFSLFSLLDYLDEPLNIFYVSETTLDRYRLSSFTYFENKLTDDDMLEIVEKCFLPLSSLTAIIEHKKKQMFANILNYKYCVKVQKEIKEIKESAKLPYNILDNKLKDIEDSIKSRSHAEFDYQVKTLFPYPS